jgi:hypothetical protein
MRQLHRHLVRVFALLLVVSQLEGHGSADSPSLSAASAVVRLPSHGASATVIHTEKGRTLLLGCGHAFLGPDRNKPIHMDGPNAPQGLPQIIACDHQLDLSLIEVKAGPVRHVAAVAGPGYRPGTRLVSVGYDEMKTPATQRPATLVGSDERLTFTRERPWHGRSGGALLDLDTGLLIGVVQGYEASPPWHGLYASHAAVLHFLRRNGWTVGEGTRQDPVPDRLLTPFLPRLPHLCPT